MNTPESRTQWSHEFDLPAWRCIFMAHWLWSTTIKIRNVAGLRILSHYHTSSRSPFHCGCASRNVTLYGNRFLIKANHARWLWNRLSSWSERIIWKMSLSYPDVARVNAVRRSKTVCKLKKLNGGFYQTFFGA